ncbi:MAG: metallophosphoesterase family protein [Ruminococcaceae bacterium]|nr:metallophosphoesterase family protein [Oscillospiraceae bacterium]
MKKILCVLLSVILIFSVFSVAVNAEKVTYEEWQEYYATCDNTQIILTPGEDETQMNFCWHSVRDGDISKPVVRLSKNEDMSKYTEFKGYSTFSDLAEQRVNNVTATGLEENTTYFYTYGTAKVQSEVETFSTNSFDSFKFLYISDAQPSYKDDLTERAFKWNRTLEAAFTANDDISFIVNAGDVTNYGKPTEEWTAVLSPEYLRSYPMAATQGNHDKKGTTYKYYFNNPNVYLGVAPTVYGNGYYFTYGDVLFVMINSMKINIFDNYNLIKKAVEENPDTKWRVAVMHYDVYGTGHHAIQDDVVAAKRSIVPVLESYDFDVALTGHDHIYGRSYFMKDDKVVETAGYENGAVTDPEGIIYFTQTASSGNTRAETYDFEWLGKTVLSENDCYSTIEITKDGQLKLVSVDSVTGETIDTFTITKTDFTVKEEKMEFGYIGEMLRPLMGEFFVIYEVFYKIFDFFYIFN